MKIKTTLDNIAIKLILVFAIVNASLRLSHNGMTSLFRLLSPFFLLLLAIKKAKVSIRQILFFVFVMAYSLIVSILFYNNLASDYYVFLFYLFILYAFMKYYSDSCDDFSDSCFSFLNLVTIFTIILCLIQYFIRIPYPYVNLPVYHGMNVFMSNENELAEPLGCMLLVYIYRFFYLNDRRFYLQIVFIVFIIYINDSKLTLLGCFLGFGILFLLFSRKKQVLGTKRDYFISTKKVFYYGFALLCLLLMIVVLINPVFVFRDYAISIDELIVDPIRRIIKMDPLLGAGSLVDRTNAIIFGIKELRSTSFFGIGLGNSVTMLSFDKYHLMTAKSMHNFFFQVICEFGYLGIICLLYLFKKTIDGLDNKNDSYSILKVAYLFAFILISSQSSIGIMSNYYTWIVTFYIFLCKPIEKDGLCDE